MDTSELHYITYDPDEMWQKAQAAYIENGGSPLYPGDERTFLLRGVEYQLFLAFAAVDAALVNATINAEGEYLDVYGEKRNCYRMQATAATAEVKITFLQTGVSKIIPAGSTLTADGVTLYELDEDLEQSGQAEEVTASITCTKAGRRGNSIIEGTIMSMVLPQAAISQIVCSAAASGGQDEETDENYRERIRTYGLSAVTTGPSEQYERIAKETSSDVIDAKAVNDPGEEEDELRVVIYVILKEDAPEETILDAILENCSPKTERPLNDHLDAAVAEDVEYTLNVEYSGTDTVNLETAVAEAITRYQAWQDDVIGQTFNPEILKSYLYQAGCTNVVFASGSEFDGGTVERTPIEMSQRCKGTITATLVEDE